MRHRVDPENVDNVRSMDVKSNPNLKSKEQDTSVTFEKDTDVISVYSDVPTFIKWVLSVEAANIKWVHITDDENICGCKAKAPKGCFKLKPPRKSNKHYGMTTYGDSR